MHEYCTLFISVQLQIADFVHDFLINFQVLPLLISDPGMCSRYFDLVTGKPVNLKHLSASQKTSYITRLADFCLGIGVTKVCYNDRQEGDIGKQTLHLGSRRVRQAWFVFFQKLGLGKAYR
jgi:hypothetical protein